MEIYLLRNEEEHVCHDYFDSVIVAAENEEEARKIHPSSSISLSDGKWIKTIYNRWGHIKEQFEVGYLEHGWIQPEYINLLKIIYLGKANEDMKKGVILSSFNAG